MATPLATLISHMKYLHEYLYVRAQSPKWPAALSSLSVCRPAVAVCVLCLAAKASMKGAPGPVVCGLSW